MQVTRRAVVATVGAIAAGGMLGRGVVAQSGTPAGTPGATRTVTDAMGVVEVPVAPQRVVALDGPVLDAAILLGVVPVGAATGVEDAPFPAYLGPDVEGIANIGTIVEPNLEAIVARQPDLIIGVKSRHEAIYEQLRAIAPTVFLEEHRTRWKANFSLVADALNRADQVEAIEDDYRTRCETLHEQLGLAETRISASVLRVYTTIVYAYQQGSFSGSVLADVGFDRPESQRDPDELAIELSPEQLQQGDGDVIFLTVWGDAASTDIATLVDNPLWPTLKAVQQGKVYPVSDEHWMVGMGYLAAGMVLDDIDTYLVAGQEPAALPGD